MQGELEGGINLFMKDLDDLDMQETSFLQPTQLTQMEAAVEWIQHLLDLILLIHCSLSILL